MVFKKIHLGTVAYGNDSFDEVASTIQSLSSNINNSEISPVKHSSVFTGTRMRRPEGWRVWEAVKALALCHNVTPVYDNKTNEVENKRGSPTKRIEIENDKEEVTYQASSPDEIALVKWTEQVNVRSKSNSDSKVICNAFRLDWLWWLEI
jgi:phospholipid-translocating ATPase